MLLRLEKFVQKRVSNEWLVALRVMLGLLMSWSAGRYLFNGWVERFYVLPEFFFAYRGLECLGPVARTLGPSGLQGVFVALTVGGLFVAAGAFFRPLCLAWTVVFTGVWLVDVTNYLNHYYLLSLLGLLLAVSPANRRWSVDSWLGLAPRTDAVARGWHIAFAGQICVVYFFAGMAKLHGDWLMHAQPLNIWLLAREDMLFFGPLFSSWWGALAMSWSGFLFDSTIWVFLLWRRTRAYAFVVVLAFHAMTSALFDIGIFPLIMPIAATALFAPAWPSALWGRIKKVLSGLRGAGKNDEVTGEERASSASSAAPHRAAERRLSEVARLRSRLLLPAIALWLCVQVVLPARALVAGRGASEVLWDEQGMRWSWRVMVRTKSGDVSYRVAWTDEEGEEVELVVPPTRYLTSYQAAEMSGQPDLIVQLGQAIGDEYAASRATGALAEAAAVRVYVDAFASLNGRRPARLILADADLRLIDPLRTPRGEWLTPPPTDAPPHLQRR